MAATIREFTVRVDVDAQSTIDEFLGPLVNALQFYRGETLRIDFVIYKGGSKVNLTGNTFQLILKDPQDVQFGVIAFSDTIIASDLPAGTFTMEINCDTPEMNTFINYSTTRQGFIWELTAFVGVVQDRKLAVATGLATSDVNQCIEGPSAIAAQIANTVRWQGLDAIATQTGTARIVNLAIYNVVKPQAIDFYIKSLSGVTVDAIVSIGTDVDDQLLLPNTSLLATTQGETVSFNLLNAPGVVNRNEFGSPTEIRLTIQTAATASSLVIVPVLRGSQISDNVPCRFSSSSSSSSTSSSSSSSSTMTCGSCIATTITLTGWPAGGWDLDDVGGVNQNGCQWTGNNTSDMGISYSTTIAVVGLYWQCTIQKGFDTMIDNTSVLVAGNPCPEGNVWSNFSTAGSCSPTGSLSLT